MAIVELDLQALPEQHGVVSNTPGQIVEINCAPVSQQAVTIVTLTGRESLPGANDAFSPELRSS